MKTTFWGVRGSVPAPLTGADVETKIAQAILSAMNTSTTILPNTATEEEVIEWMREYLPFELLSTYGGNTTCVSVECDDLPIILDMGTGIRGLGLQQMQQIFKDKRMHCIALLSHVHWDHIQGFPFWSPIYPSRKIFDCSCELYGGKSWDSKLETVLAGQMNAPVFPVFLSEIRETSMKMEFHSIHDGWETEFQTNEGSVHVLARKLNHPQETFGYRLEHHGRVLAFTTDFEPYASGIPKAMIELVQNANVWIADCQYSRGDYTGEIRGVPKQGWGHAFPEAVAEIARVTHPGCIITTHHDPQSSDIEITGLARRVEEICGITTQAAYEGFTLDV